MRKRRSMHRGFRPEKTLAGGFLLAIAVGTLLLALPVCGAQGQSIGLFEACFTATSAVCVTGLAVVDMAAVLSPPGQAVLLALIQLGGLGLGLFAALIMAALGRKITLSGRMLIREGMNATGLAGLIPLARCYGLLAMGMEGLGALLLAIRFVPRFGFGRGMFFSVFHAVSAFCNAGFDLMGSFRSLADYGRDPLVLGVIAGLVMLGGLGFPVVAEVIHHKGGWRVMSVHTKVVLWASLAATLAGTALIALLEWRNPQTLGAEGMSPGDRLLGAFFQAVSMRTAGFSTFNLGEMRDASILVCMLLMLMGASPASTGGGVKTTTVCVLVLTSWRVIRGRKDTNLFGRRLPDAVLERAVAVFGTTLAVLLVGAVLLAVAEPEVRLADVLMEATSAVATVGVSSMGTPGLSLAGKAVLIPMMFFGRVGPLTLGMALYKDGEERGNPVRYPEEKLMIG